MNPKDIIGNKKVSTFYTPVIALYHLAMAQTNGAEKYGPYNWRNEKVHASVYIAACRRHLDEWIEGEETADDSNVHHLGHAMACLAILLDALEHDCLIDDRPKGGIFSKRLKELNEQTKRKAESNTINNSHRTKRKTKS